MILSLQIIMKSIKEYIKLILTSHSGISSKRLCGVFGFLIVTFILIYCTIKQIQAPNIVEPFIYVICALLGIDSVTGIFYNRQK